MAEVTAQMVKELRDRTGAGVKEAKDILVQTEGDMKKAIEILREKGMKVSDKVQGREANEGRIELYVHPGSRMAAMVELDCETDFVARTEDFIALSKDLALHIAAMNPRYLKPEDVPADVIAESGETPEKYYEQYVLLAQPFVKDGSRTIEDKIKETVAKVRENLVVRRFVRYEIGG
ncbi:elongation factor Ts [Kouleothrix aurantiaca]|uniref:Elongation factor Ts n=1 Tax=Kouleothrix aurantiaca TaxID=186479 RepID=A0A0P9DB14_9CHLR|nr:elongation factor Ts [Kouleothrix aurantiaca]